MALLRLFLSFVGLMVVRGVLFDAAVLIDPHIPVAVGAEDALCLAKDCVSINLGAPLSVS